MIDKALVWPEAWTRMVWVGLRFDAASRLLTSPYMDGFWEQTLPSHEVNLDEGERES